MKRILLCLLTSLTFATAYAGPCAPSSGCASPDYCCTAGVHLYGDFLYWKLSGDGYDWLDITFTDLDANLEFDSQITRHYLDWNWKPGFRVGIQSQDECYGWSLFGEWTWYRTSISRTTTPDAPPAVSALVLETPRGFDTIIASISFIAPPTAQASYIYNRVDAGIAKSFEMCPQLMTHTRASFTYLHSRDHLHISYEYDVPGEVSVQQSFSETYKVSHDGVGADVTIGTDWTFCPCLGFQANLGLTALWDHRDERFNFTGTTVNGGTSTATTSDCDECWCGLFIPHISIGLDYDDCVCGFMYNLHVGWEYQILFDQTFFYPNRSQHATLQGLYAGGGFSF